MASAETILAEKLKIEAMDGTLGLYQFGLKTAKHYFCNNCGIYPFHETATKPGYFRVNLACIDGIDIFSLQADVLDGKHLL